ncbi:MAG: amidohydrolase/deacetylase family metallohydrolase [Candidatus Latescibacterota bacterium]
MAAEGTAAAKEAPRFEVLLKGGHLIDPANGRSGPLDLGIAQGKVAAVDSGMPAETAAKMVDVTGMYVVPGLIDIHVHCHVFSEYMTGSIVADGQSWRAGITTMVDAGTAGALDFGRFKERVIDKSRTRILAFVNIADHGMGPGEQEREHLLPELCAGACRAFREVVGVKSAHYWTRQPWDEKHAPWDNVDQAVRAGELCELPVMVDFWPRPPERSYEELILRKLRPGDIHTHVFAQQHPIILEDGRVNPALFEARKRGVIFDVGHGAGSFWFRNGARALEQGFPPDSISTDLHTGNAATGMVTSLLEVCNKYLNMGMELDEVIRRATVTPARQIGRSELGHLSVGAAADVAVLRLVRGSFGFFDCGRAKITGDRKLEAMLTYQAGQLCFDANALTMPRWQDAPGDYWVCKQEEEEWHPAPAPAAGSGPPPSPPWACGR